MIIGHSQFEKIPISAERQERLLREQIDEITNALSELKFQRGDSFTICLLYTSGKIVQTEKTEKPPALYDLTTLQREANRVLGYTAQQTLDYVQALYEKKLVTYPRTDSRYLTEDMAGMLPELATVTAAFCFPEAGTVSANAGQVINSKKVTCLLYTSRCV